MIRLKPFSRIGTGLVGCALLLGELTAMAGTAAATPKGWIAHSAYGIQLSVPKSWEVAYFRNCPGARAGTLLIGTPSLLSFCQNYPANTNIVTMQPEKSEAVVGTHARHFVLHGLSVVSYSLGGNVNWALPSKNIVVTATGPQSLTVLRTLTRATAHAEAAPGVLAGTEYLVALMRAPVTGPVSVARPDSHGPTLSVVQSYDGHFSAVLPPGDYQLTGHDGNVQCPTVREVVQSGRTSQAPAIYCQGD